MAHVGKGAERRDTVSGDRRVSTNLIRRTRETVGPHVAIRHPRSARSAASGSLVYPCAPAQILALLCARTFAIDRYVSARSTLSPPCECREPSCAVRA